MARLATYVLVVIVRKRLNFELSLHAMLQIPERHALRKNPHCSLFPMLQTLNTPARRQAIDIARKSVGLQWVGLAIECQKKIY